MNVNDMIKYQFYTTLNLAAKHNVSLINLLDKIKPSFEGTIPVTIFIVILTIIIFDDKTWFFTTVMVT